MANTLDKYLSGDPSETLSYDEARKIAEKCRETGDVISLTRVGANPMLRHTPYENHRGVVIDRWSCISYYFERMPERTLLSEPHIVRPWELDDWEINQITTPWVVGQLMKTWRGRVDILSVEESPFQGILEWRERDA